MRVRVEVVCDRPDLTGFENLSGLKEMKAALRSAGEQLALSADSVSVSIDSEELRIAILEFEMRRSAQYKVVNEIAETVKHWAWAFYQDITIQFPKD